MKHPYNSEMLLELQQKFLLAINVEPSFYRLCQFLALFSVMLATMSFFLNDVFYPLEAICSSPPFSQSIKPYSLFLVGAYFGQLCLQFFRRSNQLYGYGSNRSDNTSNDTAIMLIISILQFLCNVAIFAELHTSTCIDFLGVRTSPFMWIEWLTSVHAMLYLVLAMEQNRKVITGSDIAIQLCGFLGIFTFFLTNFTALSVLSHTILFTAANIFMTIAIAWLYYVVYDRYCECKLALQNNAELLNDVAKSYDLVQSLRITEQQLNATVFISFFLSFFPIVYVFRVLGYMTDEGYHLFTAFLSLLTKGTFANMLADGHALLYDPTKGLLFDHTKRSDELRHSFLRYVFHEVRVPLNSVALGTQYLKTCEELNEDSKDVVNMMQAATESMSTTLNDVLSWQKIEEGKMSLSLQPFDMLVLLERLINNFSMDLQAKEIKMKALIHKSVPRWVVGDMAIIERILCTLVSNAIKFSYQSSVIELRVTFETHKEQQVTFCVIDRGTGIPADEQPNIFRPFVLLRSGDLHANRGSGLALSVCKRLVAVHNGSIWFESKVADAISIRSGSKFYVCFPLPAAQPGPTAVDIQNGANLSHVEVTDDEARLNSEVVESPTLNGCGTVYTRRRGGDLLMLVSPEALSQIMGQEITPDESEQSSRSLLQDSSVSIARRMERLESIMESENEFESDEDEDSCLTSSGRVDISKLKVNISNHSNGEDSRQCDKIPRSTSSSSASPLNVRGNMLRTNSNTVSPKGLELMRDTATRSTRSSVASTPTTATAQLGAGLHVLVCDGDQDSCRMLDNLLTRKGCQCEQALTFEEGRYQLDVQSSADHFHLIFVDLSLDSSEGFEFVSHVRSHGYSNIIVGSVTDSEFSNQSWESQVVGLDAIYCKPLLEEAILQLLTYVQCYGARSEDLAQHPTVLTKAILVNAYNSFSTKSHNKSSVTSR